MKICTECNEVNDDGAPICKNSNCASSSFEDYKEVSNEANKELERKRKIKNTIALAVVAIYILLFLIGIGINSLGASDIIVSCFLAIIGIACLKFTGSIFMVRHIFSVKDVDESDMSDMYDTYIKLLGIIALGYSLFILF